MRIEPITEATQQATLEYLARSPYLNVFITHILLHELSPAVRKNVVVISDRGTVVGAAYLGRQVVIAAEPVAVRPLAAFLTRHRNPRMIIGPREVVGAFWELVKVRYGRPRLLRHRQLVMMVNRSRLVSGDGRVTVRNAKPEEWRAVADGSASMIAHELEYDPRRDSPSFDAGVREMIERKLWWVGVWHEQLCFFCNVGPWSDRTAQLQGIWTPEAHRGHGLATASLSAICDRLLLMSPTLSLYVNDFNEEAIALYHRVGFEHVGDFQTILF